MAVNRDVIVKIVNDYFAETLLEDEIWRATHEYAPMPPEFDKDASALEFLQSELEDALRVNDYSFVQDSIQAHLKRFKEYAFDETKLEFRLLCRECLKADIKAIGTVLQRMRGDYSGELLAGWIPENLKKLDTIAALQETPILIKAKKRGRKLSQWDAISDELRRMIKDEPKLKTESRMHLSCLLQAWYLETYKIELSPTTIRDHELMKPVFEELLESNVNN